MDILELSSLEEESDEEGSPIVDRELFPNCAIDSGSSSDDDFEFWPRSDHRNDEDDDEGGKTFSRRRTPIDSGSGDQVETFLASNITLSDFSRVNFEPQNTTFEHGNYQYTTNFASAEAENFRWNRAIPQPGHSSSTRLANLKEPHEFVDHLFTENIIEWIVDCTNEYAKSMSESFTPTNVLEMKAWFAACIFLGVRGKPATRTAFSSNALESILAVQMAFSLTRFEEIRRYIQFDKICERKEDDTDTLSEIRYVFESLFENFQAAYICSENVRIYESIIPYKGGTELRHYMPNKPGKVGIKVWGLCDAKNAYFYNGEIYSGKSSCNAEVDIALRLAEPVTNCGRTLFTDDFCTSPELVSELLKKHTYSIGMVHHQKVGIPREICNKSYQDDGKCSKFFHPRSGFLWCKTAPFMLVRYETKKNKFLYLLSSKHAAPKISAGVENKPEVFSAYNQAKTAGVDTVDKLIGRWSSTASTTRWPLRVFYWLLDVTYLNAYILYIESTSAKNERNREHSGARMQFVTDSSLALLSQKINHRATDPRLKYNPFFQKLIDIVQGFAKLAVGRKKEAILSNIPLENGTLLRTGRLSRKSSRSAAGASLIDRASTTSMDALLEFKTRSTLESATAQIERNRLRKACKMEECRGKSRKTRYKCYTCKKSICVQCIKRRSRNCVFCKNCCNL